MRIFRRRRHRRRAVAVAASSAVVVLSTFTTAENATAAPPPAPLVSDFAPIRVISSTALPELTSAESEDAVRSAKQHGVDPELEKQRARGTNQFARLVTQLQDQYPNIYVDEAWTPTAQSNEAKARISVTSTPPAAFIAEIAATGIPVDIRQVNSPNRLERLRATELAHSTATSMLGTTDVLTTADSSTGVITITTPSIPDKTRNQLVSTTAEEALAANGPRQFSVHVDAVQGPVNVQQSRGGMRLPGCTGRLLGCEARCLGHLHGRTLRINLHHI